MADSLIPCDLSEAWVGEAIELMLVERVTLLQAATLLGQSLTPQEASGLQRRRSFRDRYAAASRKFYAERGSPADTDKTVIVGAMLDDAHRLRDLGKPKESAEVLAHVAKILGYVGADTNISLFAEFSGADLQRALEQVRTRRLEARPN